MGAGTLDAWYRIRKNGAFAGSVFFRAYERAKDATGIAGVARAAMAMLASRLTCR